MPKGKYFLVKSHLNGQMLEINGGNTSAGTNVILGEQKATENENQLWYEEQFTGTIRSKLNDLCLTIDENDGLVMEEYKENNHNQEWVVAKDRIQNKNDSKQVFTVKDEESEVLQVCKTAFDGGKHQLWEMQYPEATCFHIVSEMHGKVVAVKGAHREPDGKVVIQERQNGAEHQLWYEGRHGHIRSKLNNYVLEATKDERGASIHMMPFEPGNTNQLWSRYGCKIVSLVHPKHVLGIKGKSKDNGAKLVINHDENHPHQKWLFQDIAGHTI